MKEPKIAYVKHPLSVERKNELRSQGYIIIDECYVPKEQTAVYSDKQHQPSTPAVSPIPEPEEVNSVDYKKLNNADLRKAIADMTGQDPPNNTARAKLIEIYEQAKNGQDKLEAPAPEEPTPQQAA